jgi:hypothetical protein
MGGLREGRRGRGVQNRRREPARATAGSPLASPLVTAPPARRRWRLVSRTAMVAARSSSGISECSCRQRGERARNSSSSDLCLHPLPPGRGTKSTLLPRSRDYKSSSCIVRSGMSADKRRNSERGSATALVCDFCRSTRSPHERHRVVWITRVGGELVLADLCSRCAANADRVLDLYGGRGREALTVVSEKRIAPVPAARTRTLGRIVVYLLVALGSFTLVTLISSLR